MAPVVALSFAYELRQLRRGTTHGKCKRKVGKDEMSGVGGGCLFEFSYRVKMGC